MTQHIWFYRKGSAVPCSAVSVTFGTVIFSDRLCVALSILGTTCSSEQFGLGEKSSD